MIDSTLKKMISRMVHFCAITSVGLVILIIYSLLMSLDQQTIKIGGLVVMLIAWMLEQMDRNSKD